MRETYQELKEPPEDGCYIRGMFAEGARWDYTRHVLADSRPKELFTDMPVIWLIPVSNRQIPEQGIYDCPVYKTLTRAGEWVLASFSLCVSACCSSFSENPRLDWVER